ncbi:MAG: hypothetical protein RBU37_07295 [Myxococcota bacterium]|nr:hypothetical protein [Myxococcota bacterium]
MCRFILPTLVLLVLFAQSAWADENPCTKPPEAMGVPTGAAAFDAHQATDAGSTKTLGLGDELIVRAGEGGRAAVSLWGENGCGLWLQHSFGGSPITGEDQELRPAVFIPVPKNKEGEYEVEALGAWFVLAPKGGGFYEVRLSEAISEYEGE